MKRRDFKPCIGCGKGVGDGGLVFFLVTLGRRCINPRAVQRAVGLEMMLGHPAIAEVMGPDDDLAEPLGDDTRALVCMNCSFLSLAEIAEKIDAKADAERKAEPEKEDAE